MGFIHVHSLKDSYGQPLADTGCIWMYITCPSSQSLMHPVLPDGHNNAFAKSIAYTRLLPIPEVKWANRKVTWLISSPNGHHSPMGWSNPDILWAWYLFLMPSWSAWKVALASLAKLQHARGSLAMCSEAKPSATKRCLHRSRPLWQVYNPCIHVLSILSHVRGNNRARDMTKKESIGHRKASAWHHIKPDMSLIWLDMTQQSATD